MCEGLICFWWNLKFCVIYRQGCESIVFIYSNVYSDKEAIYLFIDVLIVNPVEFYNEKSRRS